MAMTLQERFASGRAKDKKKRYTEGTESALYASAIPQKTQGGQREMGKRSLEDRFFAAKKKDLENFKQMKPDPLVTAIIKVPKEKDAGDRKVAESFTQPYIARKDSVQDTATPYAAAMQQVGSTYTAEDDPFIEDSALFKALAQARSGKSITPSLEEAYAAALPIYQRDTYTPAEAYAAAMQRVETPKTESRYLRGGRTYKAEDDPFIQAIISIQNDKTEEDRREAGALAAKLRLGEATDQDFEAYLGDIKERYGYTPMAGSQEEMLDEVQSYLRSQQPKVKNFAEQRVEGTDPLSRIGNTVTGAAKQFAGGFSEAAANVAQNVGTARIMNHFTGATTPADPFLTALTRPLDRKIAQAGRATADKLMESGALDIAKAQKGLNPAGRLLVNAGVGVTQMAGDAAIGIATGGGAMLPMLVRSFGNGAQEARQKGYNEEQQMALGLANAATEFFSEKLFGGNPVYDSDVGLINRLVGKIIKNPKVMKALASAPVEMLNEGLEEIVSDLLNPVAEWAITGNRTEYELDQIIEDGAVGVLTAMVANGGAAVTNRIFGGNHSAQNGQQHSEAVLGQEKTASTGEAGQMPYDPIEAAAIRHEGKTFRNLIAGIDTSVSAFFQKWMGGRRSQQGEKLEKLYLGKMTDEVRTQVSAILGYEVGARDFIITNDGVKHILDWHGDAEAEISRGNLPLTQAIIDALPEIVAHPDAIIKGDIEKRPPYRTGVIFQKTLSDGRVIYIQFDNSDRGTFEGRTLYVTKEEGSTSGMPASKETDIFTSETTEPEPS